MLPMLLWVLVWLLFQIDAGHICAWCSARIGKLNLVSFEVMPCLSKLWKYRNLSLSISCTLFPRAARHRAGLNGNGYGTRKVMFRHMSCCVFLVVWSFRFIKMSPNIWAGSCTVLDKTYLAGRLWEIGEAISVIFTPRKHYKLGFLML